MIINSVGSILIAKATTISNNKMYALIKCNNRIAIDNWLHVRNVTTSNIQSRGKLQVPPSPVALNMVLILVYTEFFSFLAFSESFLKCFRVFLVYYGIFIMYL